MGLDYTETNEGSVTFNKIVLLSRTNTQLTSYTIEVSDDANVWSKVVTTDESKNFAADPLTPAVHMLTVPVTARYVRWVGVTGGGNNGLRTFELYLAE